MSGLELDAGIESEVFAPVPELSKACERPGVEPDDEPVGGLIELDDSGGTGWEA